MERVLSVAFEGPHRVGKGTNIKLASTYYNSLGLPTITLRGDGSRQGMGLDDGDPKSIFWQDLCRRLHEDGTPKELWNFSSYLLSKEYLIWKDTYLPRLMRRQNSNFGVVLLDRSLLSRTLIPRELTPESNWDIVPDILYKKPTGWKGKEIDVQDVVPDILFDLYAPLETLINRLDPKDPKYEFRKKKLSDRYGWYVDAVNFIPSKYKNRVARITTTDEPINVFNEIKALIKEKVGI